MRGGDEISIGIKKMGTIAHKKKKSGDILQTLNWDKNLSPYGINGSK